MNLSIRHNYKSIVHVEVVSSMDFVSARGLQSFI